MRRSEALSPAGIALRSSYPVAVAGLGKRRCCCHSGFGLGRLGDCGLGDRCLGRRSCGFHRRIRRRYRTGLPRSRVGATSRLARAIPRHLAAGCNGLPRRSGSAIGSITTCSATVPSASTTLAAPKAPPTGVTKCAATSDPRSQATPASVPVASSRDASTASVLLAASVPNPSSSKRTP